jgi:hypothetical protein
MERPKRGQYFMELLRRTGEPKRADPQRQRVYAWEREVMGALYREDWLGAATDHSVTKSAARAGALAYLNRLWSTHAHAFSPYFTGVPYLRLGFRGAGGAHANACTHTIYCNLDSLRRVTLVHEVAHLFTWRDGGHGPQFCGALLALWEREFAIDRRAALAVAERIAVAVEAYE